MPSATFFQCLHLPPFRIVDKFPFLHKVIDSFPLCNTFMCFCNRFFFFFFFYQFPFKNNNLNPQDTSPRLVLKAQSTNFTGKIRVQFQKSRLSSPNSSFTCICIRKFNLHAFAYVNSIKIMPKPEKLGTKCHSKPSQFVEIARALCVEPPTYR